MRGALIAEQQGLQAGDVNYTVADYLHLAGKKGNQQQSQSALTSENPVKCHWDARIKEWK